MTHPGEFPTGHNYNAQLHAVELVQIYDRQLQAAVAIGYPERAEEDPLHVFPEPTMPRSAAPNPGWSSDQEKLMRLRGEQFGIGRETDRTMTELGLSGGHAFFEGGKRPKIIAEAAVVINDPSAQPSSYIFSGSARLKHEVPSQLGTTTEATEYDIARSVAEGMPGFIPLAQGDVVLSGSYDVGPGFVTGTDKSGQFTLIGYIESKPVVLFRVGRGDFRDENGEERYRNQPGPADVMRIVSEVYPTLGYDTQTPLAYVTSATYQTSRELGAVRASLATGMRIDVPTYGMRTLAYVKGEAIPTPPAANQIPGELHAIAKALHELRQDLSG